MIPELWLAPNAASVDMDGLWKRARVWSSVRQYVSTIQMYRQNLRGPFDREHATLVGQNTWEDLTLAEFGGPKWQRLGLGLAIEAAAVKPGQSTQANVDATLAAIVNARAAGARVSAVSMDEPMVAGRQQERSIVEVSEETTVFVAALAGMARVGDIEAWPMLTADEHARWIEALSDRVEIAHYHLDIDVRHARQLWPNEVQLHAEFIRLLDTVSRACASRNITLGVIVPGFWYGADESPAILAAGARWLAGKVWALARNVPRIVVQSWQGKEGEARTVPNNLPAKDPTTLTGIALHVANRWREAAA